MEQKNKFSITSIVCAIGCLMLFIQLPYMFSMLTQLYIFNMFNYHLDRTLCDIVYCLLFSSIYLYGLIQLGHAVTKIHSKVERLQSQIQNKIDTLESEK